MKLNKYISQSSLNILLVVLVFAGLIVYYRRASYNKPVEAQVDPKLVNKARAGSLKAQRAILARRQKQEQVGMNSDMLLYSIGILIVLVVVGMFVTSSENSIKSFLQGKR